MKDQAASIEYVHLVKEFQELAGGRIDKVYADGKFLLFSCYTGERRVNLVLDLPAVAYLSKDKPAFGKPGGFAMFLRKRIQGARIDAVSQVRFDRILRFDLSFFEQKFRLYVELFGKGNLIVCDEEDKILSIQESVIFTDRSLKTKDTYAPPTAQPDLRTFSQEDLAALFSGKPAVKVIASDLGLGGEYAELILSRLGIDKEEPSPDTKAIYDEIQRILTEHAPERAGDMAYPVHMIDGAEPKESFSSAIAELRDPLRENEQVQEVLAERKVERSRVQNIVDRQEQQIAGFERSAIDNQRKGELIWAHYQDLKPLLQEASRDRKSLSPDAFRKKWSAHPLVANADPQDFSIELPDAS